MHYFLSIVWFTRRTVYITFSILFGYQEDSVHYFLYIVWFTRRTVYITFSILFGLPGGQCTLLSQYCLVYQEDSVHYFLYIVWLPGEKCALLSQYRLVYQEDSVRVSIDYSGPEIDVQGLRGRWNTEGLYIHNTTDLSTMVLVLTAADPHSGLSALQWTLSTHPLAEDVGRGAVGVQRLDNTVIIWL